MQIYKDRELRETVLGEDGSFNLDLGTTMAGKESNHYFYIHNDKDCDIIEMQMVLKPVIEIKENVERNYEKCLTEIEVINFPSKLKHNASQMFEIKYKPSVEFFRSLKFGIEISCVEIPY